MQEPLIEPLTIRLFGDFEARRGEMPVPGLHLREGKRLLAFLLLRAPEPVSAQEIARHFWPAAVQARGSAVGPGSFPSVRQALNALRNALGSRVNDTNLLTRTEGRSIQLDTSGMVVDLLDFDRLARAASVAASAANGNDGGDSGQAARRAVALYRGPLLAEWSDPWIIEARRLRHLRYTFLLRQLALRAREVGQAVDEERLLRLLLQTAPGNEEMARALLRLLSQMGRHGEALAVLETLREAFAAEKKALSLDTLRLVDELRQRREAMGGNTVSPPLKTRDTTPNNLPQQVTSFIGREKAIADATALLSRTRLLTLTGSGGAGKTRLSLHLAADVLDAYPDGAWQVELAALSDPALIPQTVAEEIGIKQATGQTMMQSLTSGLRDKNVLIVLDNCEHLVTACATLVAALLRACPNVKVLATSREPLGIRGEMTYRVPSLSLPSATQAKAATPDNLSHFEAVRLFIERAQAVKTDFAVTNTNAPALAQVCYHLDGIPLAIEIAAARVRSLLVEQINDKLDDRFRLLTGGDKAALPRQQTLRAMVDWSYDLLTDTEKTLFARLSVFAGGWTLEAAEAVCSVDPIEKWEVLDLLTSLADKSLIVADTDAGADETRYRMLETLREYAKKQLGKAVVDDVLALRDKHLAWCIAYATELSPRLKGSEKKQWITKLEIDHDNFRAGLVWSMNAVGIRERALQLANILTSFWATAGHWSEARTQLSAALVREGNMEATKEQAGEQATALKWLGWLAHAQGEDSVSVSYYERSLEIAQNIGNRAIEASVLVGFGRSKRDRLEWENARSYFEQARAIWHELGRRDGEATCLGDLAYLEQERNNFGDAIDLLQQSLIIRRELKNPEEIALIFLSMGAIKSIQDNWEEAGKYFDQASVANTEAGSQEVQAQCLCGFGDVKQHQGKLPAARSFYEQSLSITREIGTKWVENIVLGRLEQLEQKELSGISASTDMDEQTKLSNGPDSSA